MTDENQTIKYNDNYISYLCQLTLLDRTKELNLINDKEYEKLKKIIMRDYNIKEDF